MKRLSSILALALMFSCVGTVPTTNVDIKITSLKFFNAVLEADFSSDVLTYNLHIDDTAEKIFYEAQSNFVLSSMIINSKQYTEDYVKSDLLVSDIVNNTFNIKVVTAGGKNSKTYKFNLIKKHFVFLDKLEIYLPNDPETYFMSASELAINDLSTFEYLIPYNSFYIKPIISDEARLALVDIYIDNVLYEVDANDGKVILNMSGGNVTSNIEIRPKTGNNVETIFYNVKFQANEGLDYLKVELSYYGFDPENPYTGGSVERTIETTSEGLTLNFGIHSYTTVNATLKYTGLSTSENIKVKYDGETYDAGENIPITLPAINQFSEAVINSQLEVYQDGSLYSINKIYPLTIIRAANTLLSKVILLEPGPDSTYIEIETFDIEDQLNLFYDFGPSCKGFYIRLVPVINDYDLILNSNYEYKVYKEEVTSGNEISLSRETDPSKCRDDICLDSGLLQTCDFAGITAILQTYKVPDSKVNYLLNFSNPD